MVLERFLHAVNAAEKGRHHYGGHVLFGNAVVPELELRKKSGRHQQRY